MHRYHRIAVIGAAGGVGRLLVELLLAHTDGQLVLAGRHLERLESVAGPLRERFDPSRLSVASGDATDADSMRQAFADCQLVINATTASANATTIAGVCIELGSDYLEMNLARTLEPLAEAADAAGVALIDQAGFHPGLPAPLIRWAAQRLDTLSVARVFMAMDADFREPSSTVELVDAVGEARGAHVRDGQWTKATYRDQQRYDFGGKFGRKQCFPLEMIELREIAAEVGLAEAGVYASGFNWFIDNVVFPINMLAYKIRKGLMRKTLSKMLYWGARRFSPRGCSVNFVLVGTGTQAGQEREFTARIDTDDGFTFTAAPVLAALRQFDDGSARRPGLQMMGIAVDPNRLFDDLAPFGVTIVSDLEPASASLGQ